jgi:hypothetical protein
VYNGCAKILILMMAIIILFQNRSQKYNISSTSLFNTRVLKLMTARGLTVNIFFGSGSVRAFELSTAWFDRGDIFGENFRDWLIV